MTGLAGALYAHYLTYISPDQFVPLLTFYVWIAVIMGGAGRIGGAVAGAALLTAVPRRDRAFCATCCRSSPRCRWPACAWR